MTKIDRKPGPSRCWLGAPLLAGTLLFAGPPTLGLGVLTATAAEPEMISIPVEGMACISCAAYVKRTVKAVEGVSDVEVSLTTRTVRLTYDPAVVSPEDVAAAIEALGYSAGSPVEAD